MSTTNETVVTSASKSADLANAKSKGSNSNGAPLNVFMSGAREASKLVGDSAAGTEKGLTALTGYTVLAYQNDDFIRGKIDNYLATRNLKLTTKALRDAADLWFETEFETSQQ